MNNSRFGRGVATLWSPRAGCPETWRLRTEGGQVHYLPSVELTPLDRAHAVRNLLKEPPQELFNLHLNKSTAIIGSHAAHCWDVLGDEVVRECSYAEVKPTGTFVVGSLVSVKLGETPYIINGVTHIIDLSGWTWHLVLSQSKLADWLSLFGDSKDWLATTESL